MPSFGRAFRSRFLLAEDATFLNHGSFGACPKEVLAEQGRVRLSMEMEPDQFFHRAIEAMSEESALRRAAASVAQFVNAPAQSVVFVENATVGVQTALRSIDLKRGDRILITNHTYNAMRLMVEECCAQTGAVAVVAQIPLASDDAIVEALLHPGGGGRPRVAIIDHITSPTALVFPLERIIPALRASGTRVIVDGAHAIGQIPLDLTALAPDWYVSNLHKWLFAPKGTAFLYASKEVAPMTRPNVVSHFIHEGFPAAFSYTGTRDNTGWLAAPAAIRFFNDLGADNVRAYQRQLIETTNELLAPLGVLPIARPEMSAAMRSYVVQRKGAATQADADALVKKLWEKERIQTWARAFEGKLLLRVSAQVYVDEADLAKLAAAIPRAT